MITLRATVPTHVPRTQPTYRFLRALAAAMLLLLTCSFSYPQDNPVADHAQHILELLRQEKFDDVAKEFNSQMAGALSVKQLDQAWSGVKGQFGDFKSIIDRNVANPQPGISVATLGCQFEKAPLNMIVAFDSGNKIAGLRFAPRPEKQ